MAAGALIMVATCLFVVWELSRAFNQNARRDALSLVRSAVSEHMVSARALADDYAIWDAMLDATLSADVAWLDENVGSGTIEDGSLDFVAVLRRDDGQAWTWRAGKREAPDRSAASLAKIGPLIARTIEASSDHRGVVTTFARDEDGAWILAARPIIPHSGDYHLEVESPLLVVGLALTPEIVAEMGGRILLSDLRLEFDVAAAAPPQVATMALEGVDGPVAMVRWTPPSPATDALFAAAPVLAVGGLIGGGLLILVAAHVLRGARALEQAMVSAQAADRAKSRLLAVVSHELRTPMNGVIGMLQMLEREALTPSARRWSQTALGSAQSLVRLVDSLLTFSSLDNGKTRLNPQPVDPSEVLGEVAALFEPAAQARNLTIVWTPPPPIVVMLDAAAVRQIATNLIGNALKFSDGGAIRITLRTQLQDRAVRLTLAVEDDGPGVPPEAAERIFEAFEQGADAAQRSDGGVGLGLSIVRRLCHAMDGDVRLVPSGRRGARFVVTLTAPAADPEQLAA
ncbi:MAG: ATP-binding protein [Rubrimonas sp.]